MIVSQFMDAFSRGDVEAADDLVTKGEEFRWYAVGTPGIAGSRLEAEARDRASLLVYFKGRSRVGESLAMDDFVINGSHQSGNGSSGDGRFVNVSFKVRRVAEDLDGRGAQLWGKGLVDCRDGRILMLGY